jgi:hypothetical protein
MAMVVVSLWRLHFAHVGGANVPFPNMIAIRPDAQTGKRNWPCRELKHQRTPKQGQKHSRFSECFIWQSFARLAKLQGEPGLELPVKQCR